MNHFVNGVKCRDGMRLIKQLKYHTRGNIFKIHLSSHHLNK
jgi:hypothetical protein